MTLTRREFLKISAATVTALSTLGSRGLSLSNLGPIIVGNPLDYYPERDWEKVYRDQYSYDSSYNWVCSPNDTHCCRIRTFVRNGIAIRQE